MSEFEQKIRESLRRADDLVIPVAPLDAGDIMSNPQTRGSTAGSGRRWVAAAAAVVVVAAGGLGSWAWLQRDGGVAAVPVSPATPAAASAMVEVDLYSGRENPRVPLELAVVRELYAMLADQEAAGELRRTGTPDLALGFRGFVVTPADGSLPRLRILPDRVVVDRDGDYRQLQDPNMLFYNRVYDAVRPRVDADVREALPDSNPTIPAVTATVPPAVGTPAVWTLASPKDVDRTSTSLSLRASRLECASGKTGKLLAPVVSLGAADIVIRVDAAPLTSGAQTCQANNSVTITVILPQAIGDRSLVDAACLEGRAVRSRNCADGGTRWIP